MIPLAGKPRLMPYDAKEPRKKYFLPDGSEVPGVTTILGTSIAQPELYRWYFNQGRDGFEFDQTTNAAADLGKLIHGRVSAYLKGYDGITLDTVDPELYAASEFGFQRFCESWEKDGHRVIASELSLVSPSLRIGGTIDIVAQDREGRIGIPDVKSTKRYLRDVPYKKHRIQVALYRMLWEENNLGSPVEWLEIRRCGKEKDDTGSVHRLWDLEKLERAARTSVSQHFALDCL